MKKACFLIFLFLIILFPAQDKIMVWPKGQMPNSKGLKTIPEEKEGMSSAIHETELYAFLPPKTKRKKIAVIIIPGGGYYKLTYNENAFQIAKWFNTLGISAFVLNYRLPTSPDLIQKEIAPLQDVQAAIKYVRKNALEYSISPDQVGVIGTSAGGHLAASVSNIFKDYTELKGGWETISTIPNFAILISPVIDMGEFTHIDSRKSLLGGNASHEKINEYSMQNRVSEKTPPTLLIHAQNDKTVSVMNSILYYQVMTKNKIKGALFIFPEGEHKIGTSNKTDLTDNWKKLCSDWLTNLFIR